MVYNWGVFRHQIWPFFVNKTATAKNDILSENLKTSCAMCGSSLPSSPPPIIKLELFNYRPNLIYDTITVRKIWVNPRQFYFTLLLTF